VAVIRTAGEKNARHGEDSSCANLTRTEIALLSLRRGEEIEKRETLGGEAKVGSSFERVLLNLQPKNRKTFSNINVRALCGRKKSHVVLKVLHKLHSGAHGRRPLKKGEIVLNDGAYIRGLRDEKWSKSRRGY